MAKPIHARIVESSSGITLHLSVQTVSPNSFPSSQTKCTVIRDVTGHIMRRKYDKQVAFSFSSAMNLDVFIVVCLV